MTEVQTNHGSESRAMVFLITGWYGTETVGDKAILGGICKTLLSRSPDARFILTSSNPFYSRRTLEELELSDVVEVVDFSSVLPSEVMEEVDAVILGGGPIMDIPELFRIARIFHQAKRLEKFVSIVGVGYGPFRRKHFQWAAKKLFKMADSVSLREQESYKEILALGYPSLRVMMGCDPAFAYIADNDEVKAAMWGTRDLLRPSVDRPDGSDLASGSENKPMIGMALREWPRKYAVDLNDSEYQEYQQYLGKYWSKWIDQMLDNLAGSIQLIPMNSFYIGDDDRKYLHSVHSSVNRRDRCVMKYGPADYRVIIEEIRACDVLIGMRYHSVVVATAMGIPTLAIDYTQGRGKVSAYMDLIGMSKYVLEIDKLTLDHGTKALKNVMLHYKDISNHLRSQTTKMRECAREAVLGPLDSIL